MQITHLNYFCHCMPELDAVFNELPIFRLKRRTIVCFQWDHADWVALMKNEKNNSSVQQFSPLNVLLFSKPTIILPTRCRCKQIQFNVRAWQHSIWQLLLFLNWSKPHFCNLLVPLKIMSVNNFFCRWEIVRVFGVQTKMVIGSCCFYATCSKVLLGTINLFIFYTG